MKLSNTLIAVALVIAAAGTTGAVRPAAGPTKWAVWLDGKKTSQIIKRVPGEPWIMTYRDPYKNQHDGWFAVAPGLLMVSVHGRNQIFVASAGRWVEIAQSAPMPWERRASDRCELRAEP